MCCPVVGGLSVSSTRLTVIAVATLVHLTVTLINYSATCCLPPVNTRVLSSSSSSSRSRSQRGPSRPCPHHVLSRHCFRGIHRLHHVESKPTDNSERTTRQDYTRVSAALSKQLGLLNLKTVQSYEYDDPCTRF